MLLVVLPFKSDAKVRTFFELTSVFAKKYAKKHIFYKQSTKKACFFVLLY